MSVSSATVVSPAWVPMRTMVSASSRAGPSVFMNAPLPTLTSRTSAPVPSAIFLLMIDEAINGIASTVPVTSRSAYSFLSAGTRPACAAQMTAPTSSSWVIISTLLSSARQPGIDSSLSSVPPVDPSPRPESCGTATPQAATNGARGKVILSPTPPVECLSAVGRDSPEKSSRSPVAIMAAVQRSSSPGVRPRKKTAIDSADICSSEHRATRDGVDQPVDLVVVELMPVAAWR